MKTVDYIYCKKIVKDSRKRAIKKGMEFDLPDEYVERMWKRQKGLCALTNIAFNLDVQDTAKWRPWAPSVDRKDRTKGYVKGNIRFVCLAVNMALFTWGDEVFDAVCKARVRKVEGKERQLELEQIEFQKQRAVIEVEREEFEGITRSVAETAFGLRQGWFCDRERKGLAVPPPLSVIETGRNKTYKYRKIDLIEFFLIHPSAKLWKPYR